MNKIKRIMIQLGSSFLFLDSINFFFLDPEDGLTLLVYGSERAAEMLFKTKEEAEQELKKLSEILIMQKNIVSFGDRYLVSDKISYLSILPSEIKEGGEDGMCVLQIFFENGFIMSEELLMSTEKKEELDQLIIDLDLGKVFKIGEEYTIVFEKIIGIHLGILEDQSGLLIETRGHEIPVCGSPEYLGILVEEIHNLSKLEPPIFSLNS